MEFDATTKINEMQTNIETLKSELREKDIYIKRLKRRTEDFENDALETEKRDEKVVKEQMDRIVKLNGDLAQLEQNNIRFEEEICERNLKIKSLENDIKDLDNITRNMVEAIRSLELENERYRIELLQLNQEIEKYKSSVAGNRIEYNNSLGSIDKDKSNKSNGFRKDEKTQLDKTANKSDEIYRTNEVTGKEATIIDDIDHTPKEEKRKKDRRILLLCDETGRDVGNLLNLSLKNYTVETIIKPGATFENVITDIVGLTHNYTINDYVIVLAGLNNFKYGRYPSISYMHSRFKQCTHTNIIIMAIPYNTVSNNNIKNYVKKFNMKLGDYILKMDSIAECKVRLLNVVSIKGILASKRNIVKKIITAINEKKESTLIFINVVNHINEHTVGSHSGLLNSPTVYSIHTVNEVNGSECEVVDEIGFLEVSKENVQINV